MLLIPCSSSLEMHKVRGLWARGSDFLYSSSSSLSTLNAGISTKCSLLFFTCVSHEVDQGAYLWQLRRRQWEQEKEKRCGIRIFTYYGIGPSGFTSFHLTPSPKRLSNLWLFSSKHSIPTYGDYKTGR